jgi:asparagine synthase (glutamine-hydrolysing)
MLASQEIYGPHDGALWSEGSLAMGRRLYRTVPEDSFDAQPLHSRDGRLVLVADVRLDNREELADAMGLVPSLAARLCDSGMLLESLDRWGEGALDRLVGDFAFALWDKSRQSLLLARDYLGQRPLHYHRGKHFFAFATMPKGLHALAEVPYAPDEQAMAEFVTLLPQVGSASFFQDIERVEGGHFVTVTRDGVTARRYWNPSPPDARPGRPDDYAEGLRHHLDQATRARLRGARGAVGTHLSAGYDSAAVTATAARLLAADGGKVVAFTAVPREGYEGRAPPNHIIDEGPLAAATAAMHPNIEHVLIRTGHVSPLDQLDRDFFLYERPTLNLCNAVWSRAINAAARDRKLGIMLTGQAGNMTVSYSGLEFLAELVRSGRVIRLLREGSKLVASGRMSWRGLVARSVGPFMPSWAWRRVQGSKGRLDVLQYTALHPDRLAELSAAAKERGHDFSYRPRRNGFDARLWVLRRFDTSNYSKGMLAGWGADQRDPTADRRLVEYCLSVPMEQFLADGEDRALARRALADRMPKAVLNERRKGYQAADWHEGVGAALASLGEEIERISECGPATRALDVARLRTLVQSWPRSGWEEPQIANAYRFALLRGVSAGYFVRQAIGSNR